MPYLLLGLIYSFSLLYFSSKNIEQARERIEVVQSTENRNITLTTIDVNHQVSAIQLQKNVLKEYFINYENHWFRDVYDFKITKHCCFSVFPNPPPFFRFH